MTPDLALVAERVRAEIGDLIDVLDREGGQYADRYAEHVLTSRSNAHAPRPPAGMPPIGVRVIREFVLDELAANRRAWGGRR